jgi:hypothetical protein
MTLFRKLQWRGAAPVLLLRAPEEFDPVAAGLAEGARTVTSLRGRGPYPFALVFLRSCREIGELAPKVAARLDEDAVLWFAYPKKSSRTLRSDIGRDDSWGPLGELGFEPVRQVAIDADWSALRFRPAEKIGTLTRDPKRALSREGKRRARAGAGLEPLFARLRALVAERAKGMPVAKDEPGCFVVHSRDTAPNGKPLEFATVAQRKRTVNVYLMPVYVNPELAADLPTGLAKRRQGKSCFNFPRIDEDRLDELDALLSACRDRWQADGRI